MSQISPSKLSRPSRRWLAAIGLVAVVAAAVASSASATNSAAAKKRNIVIGFPSELSGAQASYGQELLNIAQLAVASVNRTDKSVHVSLVSADDQSTPTTSISVVQSLIAQKVSAIVGIVTSADALATIPIEQTAKIPTLFVQTTLPNNTPQNVFTMASPVQAYVPLAISVGLKGVTPKPTTISFIYQDQPTLDAGLAAMGAQASKQGMTVASTQGGSATQTDFSSQITATLAAKPAVIAVLAFAPQTATIVTQLRQEGFKGKILGSQSTGSAPFAAGAGAAGYGVIFGTPWDPSGENAIAKSVVAQYATAYPSLPPLDVYGIQCWDAIHIIVTAIQDGNGTDAGTVKQLRTRTFTHTAVQNSVAFAPNKHGVGDAAKINGMAVEITSTGSTLQTKLLGRG